MKDIYTNDDTFLARWLNNDLTELELQNFKNSEDYNIFSEIAEKSTRFKIPSFNEDKVFEKIKTEINNTKAKTKVRKLMPNWAYSVAAAILLLLGLTFFMDNNTELISSKGQQLAYVLPDGSEVKLNGNSELSFDEKKWQNGNRILELQGEGYFKVKKGSKFSVVTKQGTISVLGTQFNVQVLNKFLSVECYEGKVNVKNSKFESVLTPGKAVKFFENAKESYNINIFEPNWLTHNYQYNGVPLSVVFKDLENLYQITIKNNKVDISQKYSGKLMKNNLEKALKVICLPMNINYTIDKGLVTITN